MAITTRSGGRGFLLKDEIEPLMVYGHLVGGVCDKLSIITKGGFVGNDNTLVHGIDYLAAKVSGYDSQRPSDSVWLNALSIYRRNTMSTKPLIGIPMGDPAGIGPEIVVKTVAAPQTRELARTVIVGDRRVLEDACRFSHVTLQIRTIKHARETGDEPGVLLFDSGGQAGC